MFWLIIIAILREAVDVKECLMLKDVIKHCTW
jgi:hypothetical protein